MLTTLVGKTGRTLCLSAIITLGCFSAHAEMEEAAITETPLTNNATGSESNDESHSHIPLHHPKHPKLNEDHPENAPVPPQQLRHYLVTHPESNTNTEN